MRHFLYLLSLVSFSFSFSQSEQILSKSGFRELIYLHTDRENYLAGETIWFKIYVVDQSDGTLSNISKVAYLEIIDSTNKPVIQEIIEISEGVGSGGIYLPLALLTSGYKVRCYTKWMRNFGPSSFFEKKLSIVNPMRQTGHEGILQGGGRDPYLAQPQHKTFLNEKFNLEVSLNKAVFAKRELVNVKINVDEIGLVNASISVFRMDSLDKYKNPIIIDYISLVSDEKIHFISDTLFIPEYEGGIFAGSLSCEEKVPSEQEVYLFSRQRNSFFYVTKSDTKGNFIFFTDQTESYPNITSFGSDSSACTNFMIAPLFSGKHSSKEIEPFLITNRDLKKINDRSVYMQIRNAERKKHFKYDSVSEAASFFGDGSINYQLDDYTRFSSLETSIREFVSHIAIRKKKSGLSIRVKNEKGNEFFEEEPLILLDGVPVSHFETVGKLDPYGIERIEILPDSYIIGNTTFQGVVGIFSKKKNQVLNPDYFQFSTFSRKVEPVFMQYNAQASKNDSSPDLRTLLYWNAELILDKNSSDLTFFTSDISGIYKGVIQGIGEFGLTAYAEFTFTVK